MKKLSYSGFRKKRVLMLPFWQWFSCSWKPTSFSWIQQNENPHYIVGTHPAIIDKKTLISLFYEFDGGCFFFLFLLPFFTFLCNLLLAVVKTPNKKWNYPNSLSAVFVFVVYFDRRQNCSFVVCRQRREWEKLRARLPVGLPNCILNIFQCHYIHGNYAWHQVTAVFTFHCLLYHSFYSNLIKCFILL